jgi:hypothetical protein
VATVLSAHGAQATADDEIYKLITLTLTKSNCRWMVIMIKTMMTIIMFFFFITIIVVIITLITIIIYANDYIILKNVVICCYVALAAAVLCISISPVGTCGPGSQISCCYHNKYQLIILVPKIIITDVLIRYLYRINSNP